MFNILLDTGIMSSGVFYFFNDSKRSNNDTPDKNKKINKVVELDFYIQNELTNVKRIKQFTNSFYTCSNSSELNAVEVNENKLRVGKKTSTTLLLEFENRKLTYLKTYLKNIENPKLYLLTIINFFKHLLNSLSILNDHLLVHNHINFDNIVVDKYDNVLLSNFSLSIDISNKNLDTYIKHFVSEYDPTYLEWPLEIHLLSFLVTNKLSSLSSYNIEKIINDYIHNNNILNTFGEKYVSSYKSEAIHYYMKYVNQPFEAILFDLVQYSWSWDNYALSILFLRILIGIHHSINVSNKFIILFMKLLVTNIHLVPNKRFSVKDTLNQFENILNNIGVEDYRQIISLISSA